MPYIILGVVALIVIWVIATYNKLVIVREKVRNSMGQIAAQIESRWDAVSSLIQATKQYSAHEAELIENVTKSRSAIGKNSSVADVQNDSEKFNSIMDKLIAVAEAYPDLKANTVYQTTMESINSYENNVRHSRMIFNDTVTMLNRAVMIFPNSIIAGIFGFHQEEYFKNTDIKSDMPSWN